jgi:antitoxin MazE
MRANIVRIGNSRGLRIPKTVLEQCGIGDAVDLTVEEDRIVLRPLRRTREGWSEAAATMVAHSDDRLLDPESTTDSDEKDWEW